MYGDIALLSFGNRESKGWKQETKVGNKSSVDITRSQKIKFKIKYNVNFKSKDYLFVTWVTSPCNRFLQP